MKTVSKIVAAAAAAGAFEWALAEYFYKRTMIRSNAKVERTMKMAGTDWSQYEPFMKQRKEAMMAENMEDVYVMSRDGLKLHGTLIGNNPKKAVICFHGYTSKGMNDFIGLSGYYLPKGYTMLLVDERAHGDSEGKYVGFGCLDRFDALKWISFMKERFGEDIKLLLHGISMGGATVLMTSGLDIPTNVKGIISDCGFTSAKEVFTSVLNTIYHLPAFPLLNICDKMNQDRAGYGLDECNAAREVRKAKVPILLIHGDKDTFVPVSICHEIYQNIKGKKKKLIVEGASHAESYYKDQAAYEKAMDEFIGGLEIE